jgi:hypothetical protein
MLVFTRLIGPGYLVAALVDVLHSHFVGRKPQREEKHNTRMKRYKKYESKVSPTRL